MRTSRSNQDTKGAAFRLPGVRIGGGSAAAGGAAAPRDILPASMAIVVAARAARQITP